jgi:Na+/H+ antiporter NhaD/arsenite permease-like protein
LLGLVCVWAIVRRGLRGLEPPLAPSEPESIPFDAWQTGKGVAIVLVITVCFLATSWPREVVALAGAGVILASRRMASRRYLGLVDWNLLVLFAGLFVVNHAMRASGMLDAVVEACHGSWLDPASPAPLFALTALLSNLVSNVPATMLLLPIATAPGSGEILALASTLAGNLLIVGSIANVIVVDQAVRAGIVIGWRDHARVGVPVTLATLAVAAAWLALTA